MVSPNDESYGAIACAITTFDPRRDVRSWTVIAPFVRQWVLEAQPDNVRKAVEFMSIGTRLADWWVTHQGMPLSDEMIDPRVGNAFLTYWSDGRHERTVSASGRQLHDLIARTRPGHSSLQRGRPFRSKPNAPYTGSEIDRVIAWAQQRPTARTRRDSLMMIYLALGFGITSTEMTGLPLEAVQDHAESGLQLTLQDRRIWCDTEFEQPLRRLFAASQPSPTLIRQTNARTVGDFLKAARRTRSNPNTLLPDLNRLRVTWFVRRASHFSGLLTTMRAYGISHTNTLQSVLAYVPELTTEEAKTLLRTVRSNR